MGPSDKAMPEVQQIVSRIARKMRRGSALRSWSQDDLSQEILRRLVERWKHYNEARGSELAFATVVAARVALMLLREAKALKRCLPAVTFTDLGGEPTPQAPYVPYTSADARFDAATLMDLLDESDLREICILLSRDGPTQIARQTGRWRPAIYRCIQRVRERAREGGFEC